MVRAKTLPTFYYRQPAPAAQQIPAVPPPKPCDCDKPDPPPREIPEAPFQPIQRLAVITSYFNPCGYQRIRENYRRFQDGLERAGVELFTAELAFEEQPFEIPDATLQLRGSDRNLLWQKERLLNLLIPRLPEDVDAIAWIDADILFLNPDWPAATCQALERRAVVQLYRDSYTLLPQGDLQHVKKSTGWYYAHDPARFTHFGHSHPGFAWAARAGWLRRHGLLDDCVTGGGDCLMVKGMADCTLYIERWLNPEWRTSIDAWASAVQAEIDGAFGYVPGAILHLYHGSRENRRYVERWSYQTDYAFDPQADIERDTNGLIRWTEQALAEKPEMVRRVREYFALRREDD